MIRMTKKQKEIVLHVLDAADEGRDLPFPELKKKLSYTAVNASINQSVENLHDAGVIVKKKLPNKRIVLAPTKTAYDLLRPSRSDLKSVLPNTFL